MPVLRRVLIALLLCSATGCERVDGSSSTSSSGGAGGSSGATSLAGSSSLAGNTSSGGGSSLGASSGAVASGSSGVVSSGSSALDGGVGDAGQGDAGPAIGLAQFCGSYPTAVCDLLEACGAFSAAGRADCLAREGAAFEDACARGVQSPAFYNAAGGAQCLSSLEVRPARCGPYEHFVPLCIEPFGANFRPCGNTTCTAAQECDNNCAAPTCRPRGMVGDTCQQWTTRDYRVCDPATGFCLAPDGGAGTCVAPVALGGDCSNANPFGRSPCAAGTACRELGDGGSQCQAALLDEAPCTDPQQCASGICRPEGRCGRGGVGAVCGNSFTDCQQGLKCLNRAPIPDAGFGNGTCGPPVVLGGACSLRPTDTCDTARSEVCLAGTCRVPPQYTQVEGEECLRAPYGQPAVPYFGFMGCQPHLGCLATPGTIRGTCLPLLAEGQPCEWGSECRNGLVCSGFPGTCRARVGAGGPCSGAGARDCLGELACLPAGDGGFTCGARQAVGQQCAGNFQACTTGAFCPASGVCTAPAGAGAACLYDTECASNGCINGVCSAMQCL